MVVLLIENNREIFTLFDGFFLIQEFSRESKGHSYSLPVEEQDSEVIITQTNTFPARFQFYTLQSIVFVFSFREMM